MTKSNLFTQPKWIQEDFCRPKELITFAGLPGVSPAVQTLILSPGAGSSTHGSGVRSQGFLDWKWWGYGTDVCCTAWTDRGRGREYQERSYIVSICCVLSFQSCDMMYVQCCCGHKCIFIMFQLSAGCSVASWEFCRSGMVLSVPLRRYLSHRNWSTFLSSHP